MAVGIETLLQGNNLYIVIGSIGVGTLLALGFYKIRDKENYVATENKQRWGRTLISPTENFGYKVGKRLHYEERPKGTVHYAYRSNSKINVDPDNRLEKEEIENQEKLSKYDAVTYSCSKGGGAVKRRVQKFLYKIGQISFLRNSENKNMFAEYYDLPTDGIEVRHDMIRIKDSVDLQQIGNNVYGEKSTRHVARRMELAASDYVNDFIKLHSNQFEQIHALNNKVAEEGKLMDKKWENIKDYKGLEENQKKKNAMNS